MIKHCKLVYEIFLIIEINTLKEKTNDTPDG